MTKATAFLDKIYPKVLVFGGAIGLAAAFVLMLEKMAVLKDPAYVPSCNLNPLLSCGPIISSDQASAFGFPNPILGLVGFAAVIVVGMSLIAGAKFARWYWQMFWAGTLFGVGFVHWLMFQSIFRLNALCPYCIVVWIVTIPIFLHTTLYLLRHNLLFPGTGPGSRILRFVEENHFGVLALWYLAILGVIVWHFWPYFKTLI